MLQVCPSRATPVQMPGPTSILLILFHSFNIFFLSGDAAENKCHIAAEFCNVLFYFIFFFSEFPGIHLPQDPWDWYIHLPIYLTKINHPCITVNMPFPESIMGRICFLLRQCLYLCFLTTPPFSSQKSMSCVPINRESTRLQLHARNSSDPL